MNYGTAAAPLEPGFLGLEDDGGLTLTHALSYTSPALDAVTDLPSPLSQFECPDFDQRGEPRSVDGNYDSVKTCDIGAFELLRQSTMLEAENANLFGALESGTCLL